VKDKQDAPAVVRDKQGVFFVKVWEESWLGEQIVNDGRTASGAKGEEHGIASGAMGEEHETASGVEGEEHETAAGVEEKEESLYKK
jgi:hypothetical protein